MSAYNMSQTPSPAPIPKVTAPATVPMIPLGPRALKSVVGGKVPTLLGAPRAAKSTAAESSIAKSASLSATGAAAVSLILVAALTVLNRRREEERAGFLLENQMPFYNNNSNRLGVPQTFY